MFLVVGFLVLVSFQVQNRGVARQLGSGSLSPLYGLYWIVFIFWFFSLFV